MERVYILLWLHLISAQTIQSRTYQHVDTSSSGEECAKTFTTRLFLMNDGEKPITEIISIEKKSHSLTDEEESTTKEMLTAQKSDPSLESYEITTGVAGITQTLRNIEKVTAINAAPDVEQDMATEPTGKEQDIIAWDIEGQENSRSSPKKEQDTANEHIADRTKRADGVYPTVILLTQPEGTEIESGGFPHPGESGMPGTGGIGAGAGAVHGRS